MDHLDVLEHRSVFLFREAYAKLRNLSLPLSSLWKWLLQ